MRSSTPVRDQGIGFPSLSCDSDGSVNAGGTTPVNRGSPDILVLAPRPRKLDRSFPLSSDDSPSEESSSVSSSFSLEDESFSSDGSAKPKGSTEDEFGKFLKEFLAYFHPIEIGMKKIGKQEPDTTILQSYVLEKSGLKDDYGTTKRFKDVIRKETEGILDTSF